MKNLITKKGYTALQKRIKQKNEELKDLQKEKAHAYTASGDGWHDNPGWTQLGQQEEMMSNEIGKLELLFQNSVIIDSELIDKSKVQIGAKVTFEMMNIKNTKRIIKTFELVGNGVSDIKDNKISISSPLGKELFNLRVRDKKTIALPNGKFDIEINEIQY